MRQSKKEMLVGVLLLALAACGSEGTGSNESGGDGEGEKPLAKVTIALSDSTPASVTSPHIALAWVGMGSYAIVDDEFPSVPIESIPLKDGLTEVRLSIFQGPPASVLQFVDGVALAMTGIYAFDDRNGDGTFEADWDGLKAPDVVYGINPTDFLLWVELEPGAELPEGMFANPEAFAPGLLRVRTQGCYGSLEIVPLDAPIVLQVFDPDAGEPPVESDDCFEECVALCMANAEEQYQECVEQFGEDECGELPFDLQLICEESCTF